MKPLIWIMLGLWLLMSMAIFLATLPLHLDTCQRPIQLSFAPIRHDIQQIIDPRTGLRIETILTSSLTYSPNSAYRYNVPELSAIHNEVHVVNLATQNTNLLYSTRNEVIIEWAVDSQSLYILELASLNSERRVTEQFFSIDIATGGILHDYPLPSTQILTRSPSKRYLFFTQSTDNSDGDDWVSINTVTGEMTDFRISNPTYINWSPDEEWIIFGSDDGAHYVINAETGALHPQIPVIDNGHSAYWTNQNIWIRHNDDGQTATWSRVSQIDGSISLEYDHVVQFNMSPDDRWGYIGLLENGEDNYYLHDRLTDEYYPDFEMLLPQFSTDSHCLLAFHKPDDNTATLELQIYNLEMIRQIYSTPLNSMSNFMPSGLRWYGE